MKNYQLLYGMLKILLLSICIPLITAQSATASTDTDQQKPASFTKEEQNVIDLSKTKWQWMSERNVDELAALFHEKAIFVHMGGTMSRQQELDVIKGGGIHYKKADIHEVSVNIIGSTAICLNKITLLAVVGGNEVTNEFAVTEVYVKEKNKWKVASLSFTKLLTR